MRLERSCDVSVDYSRLGKYYKAKTGQRADGRNQAVYMHPRHEG